MYQPSSVFVTREIMQIPKWGVFFGTPCISKSFTFYPLTMTLKQNKVKQWLIFQANYSTATKVWQKSTKIPGMN